jgi:hypothetical protein
MRPKMRSVDGGLSEVDLGPHVAGGWAGILRVIHVDAEAPAAIAKISGSNVRLAQRPFVQNDGPV